MKPKSQIFVTRPTLAPLEEFVPYLEEIWESGVLTNGGKFHQQLESELCRYLGVPFLSLFNNGTIALLTAIKALELTGQVITTPYSFIATSHSIAWNSLEPVFADIDPQTLNLDAVAAEKAITSKTSAIMPVHCYGIPCDTERFDWLGKKYGLKIIYDAAHAFGVRDQGGSILRHGDLSVLSFHATKVFNTFEGGAIISPNFEIKKKIDGLKNFGYVDELRITQVGINGKLSEINAAFGLLQLKRVDDAIFKRSLVDKLYRSLLDGIRGIRCVDFTSAVKSNFSYFPILVEDSYKLSRDELYFALQKENIVSRRYFYPLMSDFECYSSLPSASPENLAVSREAARRILCLPVYSDLNHDVVEFIASVIRREA